MHRDSGFHFANSAAIWRNNSNITVADIESVHQRNLKEANAAYAASLSDDDKSLPLPPGKKYALVTCMDARIHAPQAFGISLGDAHIIRNAGASAREALRSLTISQQLLGTEEIIVIKHTGCGMLTFENKDIHGVIDAQLGVQTKDDYLPFKDLEEAVREDVKFLKESPLISERSKEFISGWVYEVETGLAKRIV